MLCLVCYLSFVSGSPAQLQFVEVVEETRTYFARGVSSEWRPLRSVAHLILIRHVLKDRVLSKSRIYSEE